MRGGQAILGLGFSSSAASEPQSTHLLEMVSCGQWADAMSS